MNTTARRIRPSARGCPKCNYYRPRRHISVTTRCERSYDYVFNDPTFWQDTPKSVAVLGAGITGLTTAYHLAKWLPETKVTLIEASPRAGGWIRTNTIKTPKGNIIFESGPRTLRPFSTNGLITLNLMKNLQLTPDDELLLVSKDSPAAQNRYIYYGGQMNRLPHSPKSALSALRLPVMEGAMSGLATEVFRRKRSKDVEDESVASFLSRRIGEKPTYNLASAVFHGIYAGDIDKLSAQALLTKQYRDEAVYGSLLRGTFRGGDVLKRDKFLQGMYSSFNAEMLAKVKEARTSVYGLRSGMETVVERLVKQLGELGNVEMRFNEKVEGVRHDPAKDCMVIETEDKSRGSEEYRFAVSTLPAWKTGEILPSGTADELFETAGVTVMVVNLFYEGLANLPIKGFGYLIPKSVPIEQNPHRALGVILDSDALPGQDTREGTKLTVMLGGHWWDGRTDLPSQEDGIRMAREVLQHQLGVTDDPIETQASLNSNCIPQYTVNHAGRLRQVHADLMEKMGGRFVVAGNSYGGVGLNDSIRSAREAAYKVAEGLRMTGLETWAYEQPWEPAGFGI